MSAAGTTAPLRPELRAPRGVRPLRPAPSAGAAGSHGAARERGRRTVVRLVIVLLLMAVFEGALRKWVAPQLGAYIFFMRDPVLVLVYLLATRHKLWPKRNLWLSIFVGMGALGLLVLALQMASGGHSEHRAVLGIYGWRAYFLYPPLALLVGALFRRDDLQRLFRLLLWLAVPVAVLVTVQFASPQGASINVGSAEEKELQFKGLGLNAERTRPMGPFASGAGQQQFVATAFLILLAFFVSPKRLPQPAFPTLLITGAGVLTCIALSGSRGMVLQCAVALMVSQLVVVFGRSGALKGRAFFWPTVLTVAALAAYPVVFPEGYAAFVERWTAADAAESRTFESLGVLGRALWGIVDFMRLIGEVPLFGTGLGFGGNAAVTLNAKIDGLPPPYSETDFARHMVDLGPVLGLGYVFVRLALAAWLTGMAVRATRLLGDPMPLLLWSYVAYVLVMGTLTGQGTINFFGWLFVGLLIASCNAPLPGRRPTARPVLHAPLTARAPSHTAARAPRNPPFRNLKDST